MSSDSDTVRVAAPPTPFPKEKPFSRRFCDPSNTVERRLYLKALVIGTFMVGLTIFAIFPIYWGSLWKTPDRPLKGWIIDFDGGFVGQYVSQQLVTTSSATKVAFTAQPSSKYPGGPSELANDVVNQRTWVAVTTDAAVNPGASNQLQASYANPNATYNGNGAITMFAAEARNENAYRIITRPVVTALLDSIQTSFAIQAARGISPSTLSNVMATSPQTVIQPIYFTIDNVRAFNEPVATAVTFVGLIYVCILSFFVVAIAYGAREGCGLNRNLTYRSLVITRLVTSTVAYFFVSLFYSLLTLAFQLDFTRKFGRVGFVVFWMLNWVGMTAVGLALEALVTLLTPRFIPFFLVTWIIVNVAVCSQPIEVLPIIYHYGYAAPFYNISHATRCVVFATKNQVGQNFGVLFAWIAISCISLPLIQWYVRRRDERAYEHSLDQGNVESAARQASASSDEKAHIEKVQTVNNNAVPRGELYENNAGPRGEFYKGNLRRDDFQEG